MIAPTKITVTATVQAPVAQVWEAWTSPKAIQQWNAADPSWHCPSSTNDLREGGRFNYRMEARDGSFGFDFEGTYNVVSLHREITYTMDDGRVATTLFSEINGQTTVTTTFDAETQNPIDLQQ